MEYREEIRDLFGVDSDYVLAHCISADFAMGAGIAVDFVRMGVKDKLLDYHPVNRWYGEGYCIDVIAEGRTVCNLITKKKCWQKPTYPALSQALLDMKDFLVCRGKTKLAMPLIGCGIDGLQWGIVSSMIKKIFADTDIEILVCRLK